jgi:hypothetical protein
MSQQQNTAQKGLPAADESAVKDMIAVLDRAMK